MSPEIGVNDGAVRIGDFDGFLESIDGTGDVVGTAARGILVGIVGVGFSAGDREGIEETGLFVGCDVDGEGVGGPRHIWKCPRVSGLAQKDISTLFGVNMWHSYSLTV